ncbi:MAG: polysaccharide deacetylase family protein [Polyangiaceae bacterium]
MSLLSRAFVPLLALGAGTWLGMGRPDLNTTLAAAARGVSSLLGSAHQAVPELVPAPPLDRRPQTVDASALPDPPSPLPRLDPDDSAERAWLLAEGPTHAQNDGRRLVTFTFDDGPFPETAPTVLRILDQHRIRAAFFLIGEYLEGDDRHAVETRMWARRIADAGHFVGNHTRDHKLLTSLSHAAALSEIDDAAADIERATGKRPFLFRPPYGEVDPWLESALRERKLDLQLWSIDVEDMKKTDPDEIVRGLKEQLDYKHGGVVLLHDMHWPSVKAFNRLLRWMESERWDPAHPDRPGWDIVDLAEYLRATAASPQPYANREDLERARKAGQAGGERR